MAGECRDGNARGGCGRRRMLHVQKMQTVLLAMEYGVPGE
jgi:hypothetical protein